MLSILFTPRPPSVGKANELFPVATAPPELSTNPVTMFGFDRNVFDTVSPAELNIEYVKVPACDTGEMLLSNDAHTPTPSVYRGIVDVLSKI